MEVVGDQISYITHSTTNRLFINIQCSACHQAVIMTLKHDDDYNSCMMLMTTEYHVCVGFNYSESHLVIEFSGSEKRNDYCRGRGVF